MAKVNICDACGKQQTVRGTREETGRWISLHYDQPAIVDEDLQLAFVDLCSFLCLAEWASKKAMGLKQTDAVEIRQADEP